MKLGPVRVMGAGVELILFVEEVPGTYKRRFAALISSWRYIYHLILIDT